MSETEYAQNTTATGTVTIQQSTRNALRKKGVEALKHDLELMYGEDFDILETKEGIVIAVENDPSEFTFSWELKSTIKSVDYDPFIEANNYDEEVDYLYTTIYDKDGNHKITRSIKIDEDFYDKP